VYQVHGRVGLEYDTRVYYGQLTKKLTTEDTEDH